jgi:hypothetical protein
VDGTRLAAGGTLIRRYALALPPTGAGIEAAVTAASVPRLSGGPGSHGSEAAHTLTLADSVGGTGSQRAEDRLSANLARCLPRSPAAVPRRPRPPDDRHRLASENNAVFDLDVHAVLRWPLKAGESIGASAGRRGAASGGGRAGRDHPAVDHPVGSVRSRWPSTWNVSSVRKPTSPCSRWLCHRRPNVHVARSRHALRSGPYSRGITSQPCIPPRPKPCAQPPGPSPDRDGWSL